MTMYLVTVYYDRGSMVGGIFSTLDGAKEATEKACGATVPDTYGDLLAGSVQELEVDRVYSGEDMVGTHDYTQDHDLWSQMDLN